MDKEKALKIWLPVIADGVKKLPECKESLEMAIKALENQKTGHWEEEEMYDGDVAYRCSECGEEFCLMEGTPIDNLYNYCPNCGAKMKGE